MEEAYLEWLEQQDRERDRVRAVVDKIRGMKQAPAEFTMLAYYIGRHKGVPFIKHGQIDHLYRSKDLIALYEDAQELIDAIESLFEHYTPEAYDALLNEGEPIYDEQKRHEQRFAPKEQKPPKKTNVYVMFNDHTGHYKIGRSVNPSSRERTLQSQEPSVRLLVSYPGTHKDEQFLHELFASKRIRGEWFSLNDSDLTEIANYFNPSEK